MKALHTRLGGVKGSERVEIGRFLVVESKNSSCGVGEWVVLGSDTE